MIDFLVGCCAVLVAIGAVKCLGDAVVELRDWFDYCKRYRVNAAREQRRRV